MWYNMPYNTDIIKFIQSFHNPFLDMLFEAITMTAEEVFFILVVTCIYWCINKSFGYKLGFAFLMGTVINSGVKDICKVPRPIGEIGIRSLRVETATGYSFPSEHTQSSAIFWTSLMGRLKKGWFYSLGIILIISVAISRVYLGVHRPIDVIVGVLIGVVWVFVSNFLFDAAEKSGRKWLFLVLIVPALFLMFYLGSNDYYKSAGVAAGFYAGYIIEPKYIQFNEKADLKIQVLKFFIGIAGLMVIKSLFKLVLPETMFSDFIRYFLIGIWVTIAAPYIFNRFIKRADSFSSPFIPQQNKI